MQDLPLLPDTSATAAPKRSIKQKAKDTAKEGAKWAFWYGVAQLAVEVAKLFIHH
ncbi:hypothetical protein [Mucilaginibacter sp. MD40]|uniref:hypothetical protein n=1 Tax=Mucilaginibacter sp. MD40 TaxID=2029590 RepID=UPI00130400F9|nr:hypothetical protein [Mucilaginibacter sp. MD40]